MDSEKNVQAEDKPVTNELMVTSSVESATPAPKKRWVDRALPWVITGLVCLLAGALVTFFVLYQPKVSALKITQADLASATEKTTQLQGQLDTANSDLSAAQATIEELNDTLILAVKYGLIYELQADVNAALASLANQEPDSARLKLSFAIADLTELEKTDLTADTLAGFRSKIEQADDNAFSKPGDAISTLITLQSDIYDLISRQ